MTLEILGEGFYFIQEWIKPSRQKSKDWSEQTTREMQSCIG